MSGAADRAADAIRRLGYDEARATAAALARALPADLRPVFDEPFVRSHVLYGEFVCRLVQGVLRETGLDAALDAPASGPELAVRAGLDVARAGVPLDWMLRFLAARGLLEETGGTGGGRYVARGPWPVLDPAPLREEQRRYAASWLPAYELAETVAGDYPAFLRGQVAGEDVLFAPRRLRLWVDYFSNDNGLYAVNNRVGAAAADRWFPERGAVVLELGGGLGSGALALLERLETAGRLGAVATYCFTEPVGVFLRRGEEALRARYPERPGFLFGALDMNEPFAAQGVAPGSVSAVYAVNTLHAARDLGVTLGEVFRALAPGGCVVLSECVRPPRPIYAEFVFNLTEAFRAPRLDPRYRPHGGFLAARQWQAALESAGFEDVRFLPDVARIHREVPDFAVAAVGATRPARGASDPCVSIGQCECS